MATKKRHPLNMPFSQYIALLDENEARVRLGEELFNAFKEGTIDVSSVGYIPPARGGGYTREMLSDDDSVAFGRFFSELNSSSKESNEQ